MQDNFVADIGDYFKYSVLRYLTGVGVQDDFQNPNLGVMWYYTTLTKKTEGKKIRYIEKEHEGTLEPLDSSLYFTMRRIVERNERRLSAIEKADIFPSHTQFFPNELSYLGVIEKRTRITKRQEWLAEGLKKTQGQDIVFFDPDTGIEVKSYKIDSDKAPQYCYLDELLHFWRRGQSLIVYQHSDRSRDKIPHLTGKKARLEQVLPRGTQIDCAFFPSDGGRMFFIISQPEHANLLRTRTQNYIRKARCLPKDKRPKRFFTK